MGRRNDVMSLKTGLHMRYEQINQSMDMRTGFGKIPNLVVDLIVL